MTGTSNWPVPLASGKKPLTGRSDPISYFGTVFGFRTVGTIFPDQIAGSDGFGNPDD